MTPLDLAAIRARQEVVGVGAPVMTALAKPGTARLLPADIRGSIVDLCHDRSESPDPPPLPAAVAVLAHRYGLPDWFAQALVDRLGPNLADRRCTLAAQHWRRRIADLTGRYLTGVNDIGKLRFCWEVECERLRAAERVDARRLLDLVEERQ